MIWEKILIFLLLIFLPAQLGYHFWPKSSFVFGLRIDYLSLTIYLTDILITLLLLRWFLKKEGIVFVRKKAAILIVLSLFAAVNILFSLNKTISFFAWFRVAEMVLFGFYVFAHSQKIYNPLAKILPFTVIFEFFLGGLQMIKQSSLGGIFWFLGERTFNIFTPGIARASFLGESFLRPYGTFSHPNSLSGFVLVCLVLILGKKKLSALDKISLATGIILIFLAFSRVVWLAGLILGIGYLLGKLIFSSRNFFKSDFRYLAIIFTLPVLVYIFSRTTIEQSSIIGRLYLADVSLSLIKNHPVFGVGLNNFIPALSRSNLVLPWLYWLQPVHNIFLLVASETGILGLGIFLVVLFLPLKTGFACALLAILITGMFDHYWLTLPQNQLLLVIVLSLGWSFKNDKIK